MSNVVSDPTSSVVPAGARTTLITFSAAVDRCARAGVAVRLFTCAEAVPLDVRVSLSGAPPDVVVQIAIDDGTPFDPGSADQSAPETREYYVRTLIGSDRILLRLSRNGRDIDVPIVPAAAASLMVHGWSDAAQGVEACVRSDDLDAALRQLTLPEPRGARWRRYRR
jgi:hypothetical protein